MGRIATILLQSPEDFEKWKEQQRRAVGTYGQSELRDLKPSESYPAILAYHWEHDQWDRDVLKCGFIYEEDFNLQFA